MTKSTPHSNLEPPAAAQPATDLSAAQKLETVIDQMTRYAAQPHINGAWAKDTIRGWAEQLSAALSPNMPDRWSTFMPAVRDACGLAASERNRWSSMEDKRTCEHWEHVVVMLNALLLCFEKPPTERESAALSPSEEPKKPTRLTLAESESLIKWLDDAREQHQHGDKYWTELTDLIDRVRARPAADIYHTAWPDGSLYREKWLLHVWHRVPPEILAQACILAKEDTGPHYLMFMEPPGYVPKADFTCWICGKPTPHSHTHVEIEAARQTLKLFHDNVWTHLCEAQAEASAPLSPDVQEGNHNEKAESSASTSRTPAPSVGPAIGSPQPPTSEEHFWDAVANGWDIEPREYFEREAVAMGFKSPVEMAVHHMWKRHAKVWPNEELRTLGSPQPPSKARKDGIVLIAAERARQQLLENWTPEHDDAHCHGELIAAATCYLNAVRFAMVAHAHPPEWPWELSWWKPSTNPIRNLVKAGALIAAEIDRLERVAAPRSSEDESKRST